MYPNAADLHVIAVISNPVRYKSRYRLYEAFEKHMLESGVTLWTVEAAFGERPFVVTKSDNPHHIQVRHTTETWLKENLVNIGVSRLPETWKYAMFADADISFTRKDWATETIEALQHYDFVQPWSDCFDLGPEEEHMKVHKSFMYQYVNGAPFGKQYTDWHPGYAMAWRRSAFDTVGGLPEFCILGAGDRATCTGLIGKIGTSTPIGLHPHYLELLNAWETKASDLKANVGYLPGSISHRWHGKKSSRKYLDRWKILINNQFNACLDLKKNSFGVNELAGNKPKLRDEIRAYFKARREDSIDQD